MTERGSSLFFSLREEGKSLREIAAELGYKSHTTVISLLKRV